MLNVSINISRFLDGISLATVTILLCLCLNNKEEPMYSALTKQGLGITMPLF